MATVTLTDSLTPLHPVPSSVLGQQQPFHFLAPDLFLVCPIDGASPASTPATPQKRGHTGGPAP